MDIYILIMYYLNMRSRDRLIIQTSQKIKMEQIKIGQYVRTTPEYSLTSFKYGEVVEDYGSKVVIVDEESDLYDDRLTFKKSDLIPLTNEELEYMIKFNLLNN